MMQSAFTLFEKIPQSRSAPITDHKTAAKSNGTGDNGPEQETIGFMGLLAELMPISRQEIDTSKAESDGTIFNGHSLESNPLKATSLPMVVDTEIPKPMTCLSEQPIESSIGEQQSWMSVPLWAAAPLPITIGAQMTKPTTCLSEQPIGSAVGEQQAWSPKLSEVASLEAAIKTELLAPSDFSNEHSTQAILDSQRTLKQLFKSDRTLPGLELSEAVMPQNHDSVLVQMTSRDVDGLNPNESLPALESPVLDAQPKTGEAIATVVNQDLQLDFQSNPATNSDLSTLVKDKAASQGIRMGETALASQTDGTESYETNPEQLSADTYGNVLEQLIETSLLNSSSSDLVLAKTPAGVQSDVLANASKRSKAPQEGTVFRKINFQSSNSRIDQDPEVTTSIDFSAFKPLLEDAETEAPAVTKHQSQTSDPFAPKAKLFSPVAVNDSNRPSIYAKIDSGVKQEEGPQPTLRSLENIIENDGKASITPIRNETITATVTMDADTSDPQIPSVTARPMQTQGLEKAAAPSIVEKTTYGSEKDEQLDVIKQIVQKMTLRTEGQQSRMQVHLKPDLLGDLKIQIITENQQVAVRMTAESSAVKEIIEQNLQLLKSDLQHHGLEIQKFDVFVQQDNDAWKNGQHPASFNQAHQRNPRHRPGQQNETSADSDEMTAGTPLRMDPKKQGTLSEVDFFA